MNDWLRDLIARHRSAGVLVDTNILLLWFVGLFDPAQIPKFKRTAKFTPEDYGLLHEFLDRFVRIVTTPNILTETCNLAGQLPDWAKDRCAPLLTRRITAMDETYVESGVAAQSEEFPRFGLTDSGIIGLARGKFLVLTDDFKLSTFLARSGCDVINFNHLRPQAWS